MAKIGRHGKRLPLIFGFRVGHELTKGHGMHGDTLFDQTKEEHTPMRGLAPVEPEREFVKIGLQMFFFERTLMRTHQPALNERCNAVYTRQDLVGANTQIRGHITYLILAIEKITAERNGYVNELSYVSPDSMMCPLITP